MDAQELFQQGMDLGKKGLYQEATVSFTQAIAIDPDFAEAYAFRGHSRVLLDDGQGAIEDFQRALELFTARGNLVLANSMQQLIEDTQEEFRAGNRRVEDSQPIISWNIEGVPLQQRRGIESIDENIFMVLVQAPIESVSQAFSQLKQAELWQRDVYEREVEIIAQGVILFQFRGHPWTLISRLCDPPYGSGLPYQVGATEADAQNLSSLLHTRTIYYASSDTSGTIGYHLYEDGRSVEKLSFEEEVYIQFQSQQRQLATEDIGNAYNFTWNFIQEQDAYVPSLFVPECCSVGQRITLRLAYIERDDLERMDYIAYR